MLEERQRYGDQIFSRRHSTEEVRLAALAEALDGTTIDRLTRLPSRPDWRCLDIGAGLGTVSRWLAERHPAGQVVATDLDTGYLDQPARPSNLEILRHDVTEEDFPQASFDFIHSRWVFSHLSDRDRVLARVVRWLKPGGWIFLEDLTDFPLHSSPHKRYRTTSLALCAAVRRRIGTDLVWACTFPEPLRSLGLSGVRAGVHVPVVGGDSPMSRFWHLSADQLADDLRCEFGVGEDDLDHLRAKMRSDDFSDFSLGSAAMWGQRPMADRSSGNDDRGVA